jgi:uncharacterized protein
MRYVGFVLIACLLSGSAFAEPSAAPEQAAATNLNEDGITPLTAAVRQCDGGRVLELLKAGANPNDRNRDGSTALMWVGYFQNPTEATKLEIARVLVEHGADVNAVDEYGRSVLSFQATYGLAEVTKFLVAKGATDEQVSVDPTRYHSALLTAIEGGKADVVKSLLAAGINPNRPREIWAAMHYEPDAVRQALLAAPRFDKSSPHWLLMAAMEGRSDTAAQLIGMGAELNGMDEGNRTPLMLATEKGHNNIVVQLLNAGAKTDSLSKSGYGSLRGETALCLAARLGNFEAAKALLAAKADINASCGALPAAAKIGHAGMVMAMVAAGADLQDRFTGNWQALFEAAQTDRADIAQILLGGGMKVDVRGEREMTSLIVAASKGNLNMIRLLVKSGASLAAKNVSDPMNDWGGEDYHFTGTPLGWAVFKKQDAAAALLRELGATE